MLGDIVIVVIICIDQKLQKTKGNFHKPDYINQTKTKQKSLHGKWNIQQSKDKSYVMGENITSHLPDRM